MHQPTCAEELKVVEIPEANHFKHCQHLQDLQLLKKMNFLDKWRNSIHLTKTNSNHKFNIQISKMLWMTRMSSFS